MKSSQFYATIKSENRKGEEFYDRNFRAAERAGASGGLGRLMHDFNCHDAEDMNYDLLANRTRYLKENTKGVTDMCKSMEDMRDKALNEGIALGRAEGKAEGKAETLYSLVLEGLLTAAQAAGKLGLSESEFAEKFRQAETSLS